MSFSETVNKGTTMISPELVADHVEKHSTAYFAPKNIRQIVRSDTSGEDHLHEQLETKDGVSAPAREDYFQMMRRIGLELEACTGAFKFDQQDVKMFDPCMAPGGFASVFLEKNPSGRVYALTLPKHLGGHDVLIPFDKNDRRVGVGFFDITTLGLEFGLEENELGHGMRSEQPWEGRDFDLVVCDGCLLGTNREHRDDDMEEHAATKLSLSQLIMSMSRLKVGGTLLVHLQKVEAWRTIKLVHTLSEFSSIKLCRPGSDYATRDPLYLVATNVQATSDAALSAVEEWKAIWRNPVSGEDTSSYHTFDATHVGTDIAETWLDI